MLPATTKPFKSMLLAGIGAGLAALALTMTPAAAQSEIPYCEYPYYNAYYCQYYT